MDMNMIRKSLHNFKNCKGKASVIVANTVIGKGVSFMEHNLKFHYSAPTDVELMKAKEELL